MTLSPPIGIPCLPNLRVANAVTKERGTLMLPSLSFTSVFSSFMSSHFQEAHSGPTTGNLRFTEFFAASTVTSLWKSLLPKLAAFWRGGEETVQKAPAFSQLSGTKNRITDTAVVRERENLTPSERRHKQRGQVKRSIHIHLPRIQFHHRTVPTETTLHLGPHGHVDAVFLKPCVTPLSETHTMFVWAMHCAVLLEGLRTTATLIVFLLCSHN